jgi:hypothetical protein
MLLLYVLDSFVTSFILNVISSKRKMDKNQQIALLRKEHQSAIDNFDFDRAESISNQIKKIMSNKKTNSPQKTDLTETREKFLTSSQRIEMNNTKKRAAIQNKFHALIKEKQEQHTEQLQHLDLQYTIAIEREINRPIYEVNLKYKQAKGFGQAHEYELAKRIYADAQRIEEEVKEKRKRNFEKLYKKQRKSLIVKQEAEIKMLSDKLQRALVELSVKVQKEEAIIENTRKASEFRATKKTREYPVVACTMTPRKRRSASVSSSRTSSRQSTPRQSFKL